MTILVVVDASGLEHTIEGADGLSVMKVLRPYSLGIQGDCEGSVACATCHVWIDKDWASRIPAASDEEADMLDCVFNVRATSRLSCQIQVKPQLGGLRLAIPRT